MPQRDAPSTVDPPAENTLRRLSAFLPFIGFLLVVALIVWRRPGPGFDDVGSVAVVLGFAVLAVVAYLLELAAGHRQARAAQAALDEYDAGLSQLPKSGLSPVELGYLAGSEQRSLLVTVFQLRQAGALAADPEGWAPRVQRASGPLPPDAEPMARVLHAAARKRLDLIDLHWGGENRPARLNEATQAIVDRLEAAGLLRKIDVRDRFPKGVQTRYPFLLGLLGWPVAVALAATDGWGSAALVLLVHFFVDARTDNGLVYINAGRYGNSPAGEKTLQAARTRSATSAAEAVAVLGEKALAEHDPQLARIVRDGEFAERQPEYWADGAF